MKAYKKILNKAGELISIRRASDGAFIPIDEANADYQAFLKWCDAGNQPETGRI